MNDRQLEERVTELLHYPIAGRLPDNAVAALSVWLLRKRGILPEKK